MPLQTKQFYEFANFRLDLEEKVLLRDGRPVALTPKVFDTLVVLIENAGRLLEKDEFIKSIWQDRFVEKGNLAFNIKMLRKALGDDAANPRFIQTVSTRGYRFIAQVRKVEREGETFSKETFVEVSSDFEEMDSTIPYEDAPPVDLSVELSTIIGRQTELEEIAGLMKRPDVRLLTITGVGGTGKTRLAREIARQCLTKFSDGVYFIDLSAIEKPELVGAVIAHTLGTREESGRTLKDHLVEYLRERKILLVLDNFEQIAGASTQIGELLTGTANLKIIVTSRVRLYLSFEHEFPLQPLDFPKDEGLTADQLANYAAVALFVERAKSVKPFFELTEENASSIAGICRQLDGLPLAIELAAVRVKLFAPPAILARLSNALQLLTGGARDLPERQRTMRAAISWSYDLLDAEEKALFNRLSVFAGGFTLEAAEAVANSEADLPADLLETLSSLFDKSLLSQREQPDGEPRFRMLAVVREFALEALAESAELEQIKGRHARFFARLAEAAEPELMSERGAEWLEILEREHDNLRSAIEWSLENEPETALQIVSALRNFWFVRGYLSEGVNWIRQALEKSGADADPKLRAKAFYSIGNLSRFQGNLEAAGTFLEESLSLTRQIGDKSLILFSFWGLGMLSLERNDLTRAKELIEESLAIARELNDRQEISLRLTGLGEIARAQEDYEAAKRYYEEALAIARQESSKYYISVNTSNLAYTVCLLGDYRSAYSYALECLEVSVEMGDKRNMGITLSIFGALAVKAGEMERAARFWGAAQAIFEAIGYKLAKVDQEFNEPFVRMARETIGNEAFEESFQAGRLMNTKKAIELARLLARIAL